MVCPSSTKQLTPSFVPEKWVSLATDITQELGAETVSLSRPMATPLSHQLCFL